MRIRTRSFIIISSKSVTQIVTIILGIVLVRIISKHTFGTYRQTLLVYVFLTSIISLHLQDSLYYFIPKLGFERRDTLLSQTLLAALFTALISGSFMYFGAGIISKIFNNPDLVPLIRIFALYPFVEKIAILIPAFMISVDRPLRAGVYILVSATARLTVVILTFVLGYGLQVVMWAIVITMGLIALVGFIDMARLTPRKSWHLDRSLVLEQFHYSWPLLATAVVATINVQFDKFLISAFFNSSTYAVYSCGAVKLPIIEVVTSSVAAAMMPNLVTMAEDGQIESALNIWQEAARKCSFIIFPAFAFFMAFGYDFIVLLYGEEYSLAHLPFRIYLGSLPIRVAIYSTLFRAFGITKPIAIGALVGLVTNAIISTSLVIIGNRGTLSFIGPAIGTVSASLATWMYLLWRLTRVTAIPFNRIMRWKELSIILLVCVVCVCVVILISITLVSLPLLVKLVIQAIMYLSLLLIIMWITGVLKAEISQFIRR